MTTFKLFKKTILSTPWHFWFTKWWWQYLRDNRNGDKGYCSKWHRFWCRASGHTEGVWYYSSGNEPDYHCKGCGDDLG